MSKRISIVTSLALCVVIAGILFARGGIDLRSTSDLKSEETTSAWPADQVWSWSFNLPDDIRNDIYRKQGGLSLRVRTRTLPATSSFTMPLAPAPIGHADAEHEFGIGMLMLSSRGVGPQPRSGNATVQLLDLSKIGAMSSKPGQDLRLLAKLSVGGSQIDLAGDDMFLPAGHIAGTTKQGEGQWKNHELYLMSFYIQNDSAFSRYDVLLEHSPSGPIDCER